MLLENDNQVFWISLVEASQVQSLIFDKGSFSVQDAKDWAKKHGFKFGSVDQKENTIRLRQKSPSRFSRMRTKGFGKGVKAVIGFE